MKKKLLVFPCGSEVAIEIYKSLRFSTHFELVGASSVNDHGRFVFENYIGDIPFHDDPAFIEKISQAIENASIDGVFPAMDAVANTLKANEASLGCVVIGSRLEATRLCASKRATYQALGASVPCPNWTCDPEEVRKFPVFIKPDEGYGSRNVYLASDQDSAKRFIESQSGKTFICCDYLPGDEFTIDCFSNSQHDLLFSGARKRARISNGISVNTVETQSHSQMFKEVAETINEQLKPRGAWFFQMKEDSYGKPILLEVAARLGGSSSYFRAKGVNFALLSAFDAFDVPVAIRTNGYHVELDRALGARFKLNCNYDTVYVDFDDCLLINCNVNTELIAFLYQALNKGKAIVLITRHGACIEDTLKAHRLTAVFDQVVHLSADERKADYIAPGSAIFIDDSFAEREDVASTLGIPVFSPDMIEALLDRP